MKKKAFTLVDLLFVIAITAVLAGLMLPAIHKARSAANYQKILKGTADFKLENEMKEYLTQNPKSKKMLIERYGHWKGVTDTEKISKPEKTKPQETIVSQETTNEALLIAKIKTLQQKVNILEKPKEEGPKPYAYEIKDKRNTYGWKSVILRDGKEIYVGNSKSECETILELIKEGFENGRLIGKKEGKE